MLAPYHREFLMPILITSSSRLHRFLSIRHVAVDEIRVSVPLHELTCSAGLERDNSQFIQHVNLGVSKILSNLPKKNLHLFCCPSQHMRAKPESKSLESGFKLDQIPAANGFLCPR